MHRFAEAVPHWDRVIELADEPARRDYRLRRALARARGNDRARAAAEAEALAAEPNCPPDALYNAACVFSLADRAEKAVALLSRLRDDGYFEKAEQLNNLRTDPDLDPLRQRADFIELTKGRATRDTPHRPNSDRAR